MNRDKQNDASFICKSCGAKLNVDVSQVMAICDHCGNSALVSELLNESDEVKIQKIKSQAYKDVELGKQQLAAEKIKSEAVKEKQQAETNTGEKFKKSKFSKVLIVFAVISALMCAVGFNDNRTLAGIVALIQTVLFIVSWLMGMRILKEKKKGIRIIAAIIAFMLFIPYLNLYNSAANKGTPFEWNEIELSKMLPIPESTVGEIHSNSKTELMLDVYDITEAQFNDYIDSCKEMGFTIEADLSGISFTAYNQDGYRLSLSYYESSAELSINIDAPMEMSQIQWPSSEIAKLLPVPKSNIGSIYWENSGGFVIYIGKTTNAEYNDYVNDCSAKGFNVDYHKGNDYYYADNAAGYHVSLRYEGNNVMCVHIEEPDDVTSSEKENKESVTNYLKDFISRYNELADTPITNRVSFDPTDKESGYYRHEYRLNAWQGSIGEAGKIGESTIEITNYGLYGGFYDENDSIRIHFTTNTIEEMVHAVPALLKALDSSVSEAEIQEVQQGIKETTFSQESFLDIGNMDISFIKNADSYKLMLDIDY